MIYNAPIKDMMFLLTESMQLSTLTSLPGYEDVDTDLLEAILEEAGKFSSTELLPINREGDEHGATLRQRQGKHTAWFQRGVCKICRERLDGNRFKP